MKLLMIVTALFLTGCASKPVPIAHSLPEIPQALIEKCLPLKQLPADEQRLSEFLKIVAQNYSQYHECSAKHEMIIKWYDEQKIVHDTIFNKK